MTRGLFTWLGLVFTVLRSHAALAISLKDQKAIREQLGYVPSNAVRVACWTHQPPYEPVVLQTYPLDGGSSRRKRRTEIRPPFPTLYWLCHARIHDLVSELERLGYTKKGTGFMLNETELLQLNECHLSYAKERWESLAHEDRQSLPDRIVPMLRDSGIAGANCTATDAPSIKCLHAHYAHFRVHGKNPVGAHVDRLLKQKWPDVLL